MGAGIFIGYGSIDTLLAGRDKGTRLYLFSGISVAASQVLIIHARTYYALMSLIEGNTVHYCRIDYARAEVMIDQEGNPVPDCARQLGRINQQGESLIACIRKYVAGQGFADPVDASPSFPRDLQLVSGHVGFLKLNDARTGYTFVEMGVK